MNFERELSTEEILTALEKGSDKADIILERAKSNPDFLKTAHSSVVTIVDRAEEHFSLEGYRAKNSIYSEGKQPLTEANIRGLFLCAVEAVQCLEELESHMPQSKSSDVIPAIGLAKHIVLIKAANVFRTDGQSDIPAMDVEEVIHNYRLQKLDAA